MPTHPTRASSADRCPVEPPSPSSAEDLPAAPSGEEARGAEDRESGQVGWKRLAPELPDAVIAHSPRRCRCRCSERRGYVRRPRRRAPGNQEIVLI